MKTTKPGNAVGMPSVTRNCIILPNAGSRRKTKAKIVALAKESVAARIEQLFQEADKASFPDGSRNQVTWGDFTKLSEKICSSSMPSADAVLEILKAEMLNHDAPMPAKPAAAKPIAAKSVATK